MADIVTPTKARSNLYGLINEANRDAKPVIIAGATDEKSAVLISKREYDELQETLALVANGQLQDAIKRDDEDDEAVDLDEMIAEIDG
ncbi:type II toxin-antitoxin system prevent-host-death family antitoxin [Lactobacillus sp. ESL0684]|uniref:type II toxin-antitoxin system Phd/YefM family antitoxin n=1 Tax=unclassified Lactobacillus TaxID=2620435 RepID=UPI0023F8FD71|nr:MULTISPECIES: type II toxin-antitoxin system prevent-host-death family antitoxin [unclassified Lactobacillus]WEV40371.1 type II toxin-antitoxin system prevent-host-death family antitoxin [Lactobacillus sp. ESL0681]WEV42941.1 type II toxin-antitoxin system prevent-host-death family antitoxin [Lactobacillus sp. ESL0684]